MLCKEDFQPLFFHCNRNKRSLTCDLLFIQSKGKSYPTNRNVQFDLSAIKSNNKNVLRPFMHLLICTLQYFYQISQVYSIVWIFVVYSLVFCSSLVDPRRKNTTGIWRFKCLLHSFLEMIFYTQKSVIPPYGNVILTESILYLMEEQHLTTCKYIYTRRSIIFSL